MLITVVYALSYASAMGLLLVWRLSQFLTTQAREHIFSTFAKWLLFTVVLPRMNGSSDITTMAGSIIILFIVANVVGCVLLVQSQSELSTRLARMCVTNLVVLFLGGRSNLLVDKIFRLSNAEYHLLHRWVGRVAVIEGLAHATISITKTRVATPALDISLYAILGIIALFSVIYIRRRMYELFLRTHFLGSVAFLILLWFHIRQPDTHLFTCLVASATLLLTQKLSCLLFFLYRNLSSGPSCQASIVRFPQSGSGEEVLQVRLNVKRPWTVVPGQYVYISLPALRIFYLGFLESHPFMVAWPIYDDRGQLESIVLLVQTCRGFTRRLQMSKTTSSAFIDGPYGGVETESLGGYDKVLLMSCGIGLASHLGTARHLLLAHNRQTARIRRLTLVWLLESQEQMRWAEDFLCALDDMDSRQILTVFLFYPDHIEGSSEGRATKFQAPRKRMLSLSGKLDMSWFIESEWGAEAGNMLLAVCGSPRFELRARQAVRSSTHHIDFRNSMFLPDESQIDMVR
ncbi:hypothetical protein T440DRAFT_508606 [Plenodomus tracheiphilus IPT5]|uniref:FAD-binding FR-type domain-containing protein n=1 Tax=Plenodomus tracheiphilus IPT5 TaxID=1408161 RepID=A0A6A7B1L4_9PLEO|nr:hypothetical protein T440DRAFT_508606 [Plenodomus tracheiphilus IPT5]